MSFNPFENLGSIYRPAIESKFLSMNRIGGMNNAPYNSSNPFGGQAPTNPLSVGVANGIDFAGNVANIFNSNSTVDPLIKDADIDPDNPTLNSSAYLANMANNSDDEASKVGNANIMGGVASGAKLGSMFGPLGAGIGGAVGAITGLIGKGKRKRKAKEQREKAREQYNNLMFDYNDAKADSIMRDTAMARGLQNSYGSQGSFPSSMYGLI